MQWFVELCHCFDANTTHDYLCTITVIVQLLRHPTVGVSKLIHRNIRVNRYFNLIVLQTATQGLTGRTVKKTVDIAMTISRVMLRMDAVQAAVTLGMRLAFAKHTYVSKMHIFFINQQNALVM